MALRYFVIILSACAGWFLPTAATAQERCSTSKYEAQRQASRPGRETPAQFEVWMKSRLATLPQITSATYTIPVVVHVLHNGTFDVTNISDAQVLSQIDVLNKDFKRLNLDAGNTPPEFLSVAGSIDIDFVLAQRDPEGLPTNGITRTLATKSQWSLADQSEFKALSYWPAENYLNIWVLNFGSNDIGFAQFPVSNSLAGLEMASEDRLTDGIVVDYRAFGSIDAGAFPLFNGYDKGRTATHEIGHFLGLRHIWGDMSTCTDNDFVPDTPPQSGPTSFCPTHPQVSCSTNKMFMNYMDYTYDACMNLFTANQVNRMVVVLAESPRRASLLTSPGATPPVVAMNDLGIRNVLLPGTSTCVDQVAPQLEFRNYGTNTINAATLEIDASGQVSQVPLTLSLSPGQVTTLTFAAIPLTPGPYNFSFTILNTNGGTDGNPENDQVTRGVMVYAGTSLPILEPFDNTPANWIISNPDNLIGWVNASAPDSSPSNRAMKVEFYNYDTPGVLDWAISPPFNLNIPASSLLRFDVAYAQYPGQNNDALRVYALPDCNTDLNQAILLYDKAGPMLATATTTSNPFMPVNESQWRKSELVSLSGLSPSVRWQLAFVSRNGYGNNVYLDNVTVTENEFHDISLLGAVSPGIVHCETKPVIRIRVANLSTLAVQAFHVNYSIAGGESKFHSFSGIQLDVGEVDTFDLPAIAFGPGPNQVTLTIGLTSLVDIFPSNNTYSFVSVVDLSQDKGPLRMTFDNPNDEQPWRVASPSNAQDWEAVHTNKDQSLTYRSFTNPAIGEESWLVSPILDLSKSSFSLFFDVSYAQKVPADDRLLVLASRDCGVNYDEVLMDRAASTFTGAQNSSEWQPTTNDDWSREYVSLDNLALLQNIRLAFVVRNDNGNNLFLDNIELFEGDDPNPPLTSVPYQLYYSSRYTQSDVALTLKLSSRQDVQVQILSIQGNLVAEHLLTDALNQTYYFDLSQQAAGLYIFRLLIDNSFSATKVFIGH